MNIKILTHIMPWDIDYALLMFTQLKKASYALSPDDNIYIDSTLNLSNSIIDWDTSKLPKDFFIEKYKTISTLLDWSIHTPFIYEGNEIYGHLDSQRNQVSPHIDYYINICPDMYFHEHLLFYLIESAKTIKDDYFIITPQIYKMWDSTWDHLTHPKYKNIPYNEWDKGDIFDIINFTNNNSEPTSLKETYNFKWAGWFDIYSKKFVEDLMPILDEWKGYGPWDWYSMMLSDKVRKEGLPIKEYILENQIIFEYQTGLLKTNNFSSYYRNNITIKTDGPNQRQAFESKMNEYLQKGYQMIKDKKII